MVIFIIIGLFLLLDVVAGSWEDRKTRLAVRVLFLVSLIVGGGLFFFLSHEVAEDGEAVMQSFTVYREVTDKDTPDYQLTVESLPGMKVITYTDKKYEKILMNAATVRYYITPDLRVEKL
ncbi:MAG: hypothetical protein ACI4OH_05220 [Mitsuokella sp.]|uniref:hypothetical protein n=1 Tax=Mitsuokella sp. TaxID=2049034 RepID=UPI003F0AFE1C